MIRTGGNFDPTQRYKYFLVSDRTVVRKGVNKIPGNNLVALNELFQDFYPLDALLENGNCTLLDSGGLDLAKQVRDKYSISLDEAFSMDEKEYAQYDKFFDKYVETSKLYGDRLWGFIEIDLGSTEQKIERRTKMEKMGIYPIPVFHAGRDNPQYFTYLLDNYDRIAVGSLYSSSKPQVNKILNYVWKQHIRHPDVWIHLLGLSTSENALSWWPCSTDSSGWMAGFRWPASFCETAMLETIPWKMQKEFLPAMDFIKKNQYPKFVRLSCLQANTRSLIWQDWADQIALIEGQNDEDFGCN